MGWLDRVDQENEHWAKVERGEIPEADEPTRSNASVALGGVAVVGTVIALAVVAMFLALAGGG